MPLWLEARTELMGRRQLGFCGSGLTTVKKQAKRETSLAGLDAMVPWQALSQLIAPMTSNQARTLAIHVVCGAR